MFERKKDPDGNYICWLCTGTYVSSEEREEENEVCKYTGEPITEEYASKKFWMLPADYFSSKLSEIQDIIKFAQKSLKSDDKLRQKFASVLYSQLVTALEVYLREEFLIGMESPKAFDDFVKRHLWTTKYYPNEIHADIKSLVDAEIRKISFQSFGEVGRVYRAAFSVHIFGFPEPLKCEINRILRYRHSLVHQDEIWEDGHFVKIDLPQIRSDIATTKDFVSRIEESFEKNIGSPSEIKMARVKIETIKDDHMLDSCEKCPLGIKSDDETIVCYEGAYDGIGFGIRASEWKTPPCGSISFQEAMRQRKILGENALFGMISAYHFGDKKDKHSSSEKSGKNKSRNRN